MAPRGGKATKVASPIPGEDRISALPEAVLQHLLGFLPAQDAVRTCVLAKPWRNLWRSLPRLRITDDNHMFVNQFLLLREQGSTLDHCEFDLRACTGGSNRRYVDLWIRHALLLGAREMHLRWCTALWNERPLVSTCLKILRIELVHFSITVDFSSCRVLEDLQITSCKLNVCEIRSHSIKRLSLVDCTFGVAPWLGEDRAHICVPSLVFLEVQGCDGINPVLESMPLLQDASVWFGCSDESGKSCTAGSRSRNGKCLACDEKISKKDNDGCVLLGGLSNVTAFKLRGSFGLFTFGKDLVFCPTFKKLRTFYLVNWCLTSDISALRGFLHHTPNLEKLTLQLCEKEMCSQMQIEVYNPFEARILLTQLHTVKVICVSSMVERVQTALETIFVTLGCPILQKLNFQNI